MQRIVLLYLVLLCSLQAMAQQSFMRDVWLNEASTPVKTNAILQDSNGYLWLGTDEGVYRFNGRSFTVIHDDIHKPVTAIALQGRTIIAGYADGTVGYVADDKVIRKTIKGD